MSGAFRWLEKEERSGLACGFVRKGVVQVHKGCTARG